MIRFRHADDEKKYVLLRTEIARGLSSLPRPAAAAAMQAFAKIELLLQLEGVRQGLALAALHRLEADREENALPPPPDPRALKAFQTHAMRYGSQDTPLIDVEMEWMAKWGWTEQDHPWLDPEPMRFAAQPISVTDNADMARGWGPMAPGLLPAKGEPGEPEPISDEQREEWGFHSLPHGDREDDLRPESPNFLSNVRETIRELLQAGWKPKDWTDLIMRLHLHMQVDAAFLDLQLSTEMGRAVIAQNGLFHVQPGAGIFLEDLAAAAAVAAHEEEGDANQGEASQDNGSDPDVVPGTL